MNKQQMSDLRSQFIRKNVALEVYVWPYMCKLRQEQAGPCKLDDLLSDAFEFAKVAIISGPLLNPLRFRTTRSTTNFVTGR